MGLELLYVFVILRIAQELIELYLSWLNRRYYLNPEKQKEAQTLLNLSHEDLAKSLAYSNDKYQFGMVKTVIMTILSLSFLAWGGLGFFEVWAQEMTHAYGESQLIMGLTFFALLGFVWSIVDLPFDYYQTFVIEQKHGFNRQTIKGFITDRVKGLVLAVLLGGPLLGAILYIMANMGEYWWLWAWGAMTAFSVFASWIFPTVLAPFFNKFTPLTDGELKEKILRLAKEVRFNAGGLYVMDASRRSSHGNAYFTGVFNKKRIVLFDTLIESLKNDEIVSVLAHELGHFKLNHVRISLVRGVLTTGIMLYVLSLCLPMAAFYDSFALEGVSSYGALIVFSLWFEPIGFLFHPLGTWLSRRNEFAADRFALMHTENKKTLAEALLKLREKSQQMPITHPLFSMIYYSHPPMIERLKAMNFLRVS